MNQALYAHMNNKRKMKKQKKQKKTPPPNVWDELMTQFPGITTLEQLRASEQLLILKTAHSPISSVLSFLSAL
jgi:hypothetical protein